MNYKGMDKNIDYIYLTWDCVPCIFQDFCKPSTLLFSYHTHNITISVIWIIVSYVYGAYKMPLVHIVIVYQLNAIAMCVLHSPLTDLGKVPTWFV